MCTFGAPRIFSAPWNVCRISTVLKLVGIVLMYIILQRIRDSLFYWWCKTLCHPCVLRLACFVDVELNISEIYLKRFYAHLIKKKMLISPSTNNKTNSWCVFHTGVDGKCFVNELMLTALANGFCNATFFWCRFFQLPYPRPFKEFFLHSRRSSSSIYQFQLKWCKFDSVPLLYTRILPTKLLSVRCSKCGRLHQTDSFFNVSFSDFTSPFSEDAISVHLVLFIDELIHLIWFTRYCQHSTK